MSDTNVNASKRPRLFRPGKIILRFQRSDIRIGFKEAQAISPGKAIYGLYGQYYQDTRFKEAQAISPGKESYSIDWVKK